MNRFYYGMVGNGETAALIGPDLALRWLCLPRFDGTPFFASALDPKRGGQLAIHWDGWDGAAEAKGGAALEQAYIPRTNVLRSSVTAAGLRVESVDSMPWGRPLLLRRLTVTKAGGAALSGAGGETFVADGGGAATVRLTAAARPTASAQWMFHVDDEVDRADHDDAERDADFDTDFDTVEARDAASRRTMVVVERDAALVVGWVRGGDDPGADACKAAGTSTVSARIPLVDGRGGNKGGENTSPSPVEGAVAVDLPRPAPGESVHAVLLLAYGVDREEAVDRWRQAAAELDRRPPGDPEGLQEEVAFWSDWLRRARRPRKADAELMDAYVRGLLVMKLLTHEASGAILAAPTASFPAVPGGHDNWDYRYCWIRDGYFSARTFDEAGLHREARAFYEFVLRLQQPAGHWRQPLYTLDGDGPVELLVDDLAGPGGEKPIRFGNAAYDQLQIDNEPSVLHGLWIHAQRTGERQFFADRWDAIRRAAEAMTRLWPQKENGIWEIRERRDHWVYGKALCAAGFRAAAALARWLGHDEDAVRWQVEADKIREQVVAKGFSEQRGAYLQTYDPDSPLDISALALALWDVLPADDPRIRRTVRKMEQPLRRPEPVVSAGPGSPGDVSPSVAVSSSAQPITDDQSVRDDQPITDDRPIADAQPKTDDQSTTDDPYWGLHELKGGLEMDGAFARYDYGAEPFYLPTLWMARYWLRAGNRQRAEQLVRLCLRSATNLGLMAEHFNPTSGTQWGNFPQAFSHEEMALTILELEQIQRIQEKELPIVP